MDRKKWSIPWNMPEPDYQISTLSDWYNPLRSISFTGLILWIFFGNAIDGHGPLESLEFTDCVGPRVSPERLPYDVVRHYQRGACARCTTSVVTRRDQNQGCFYPHEMESFRSPTAICQTTLVINLQATRKNPQQKTFHPQLVSLYIGRTRRLVFELKQNHS